MCSPASRTAVLVLGVLVAFAHRPVQAADSARSSSGGPGSHGLSLQLRAVKTSEWSERYPGMDASFPQKPAYGLGMELAYALGNVVPFVAADFSLQRVGSTGGMGFGSADGFGTVAGGIRVRRPVSRHVVPFAQASIARLRLSAPVYTQPFVGGGLEYSVGHHTALIAGVDLPVAGSSLLDDKPSRLFLGMGWGLGSR